MNIIGPIKQSDFYRAYVVDNPINESILEKNEIRYWIPREYKEVLFVALDEHGGVAGMIGLQQSTYERQDDLLWLKFVSTKKEYEGKGIATQLIELGFKYAELNGKSILNSSYHRDGITRLPHVFKRISAQFPNVSFYESKEQEDYKSAFNLKYSGRVELSIKP